ncbi:MAG TPA: hypothetical protein VM260_13800 [Pirellula sp.]|nr:hypothetical protein [Pirellula sp.]
MKIVCYDPNRAQQVIRPVRFKQEYRIESYLRSMEAQRELCRALWLELHTKEDPTPAWFETWVARVPNFDCGCRSWLRGYIVTNPPRYSDWHPWTVELHNAVNVKRGVGVWTPPE